MPPSPRQTDAPRIASIAVAAWLALNFARRRRTASTWREATSAGRPHASPKAQDFAAARSIRYEDVPKSLRQSVVRKHSNRNLAWHLFIGAVYGAFVVGMIHFLVNLLAWMAKNDARDETIYESIGHFAFIESLAPQLYMVIFILTMLFTTGWGLNNRYNSMLIQGKVYEDLERQLGKKVV